MSADPSEPRAARDPGERFVWPPGLTVRAEDIGSAPDRAGAVEGPRNAGWWRQVEGVWLGVEREPWAARAAAAGWRPDRPGEYCPACGASVGPHEVFDTPGGVPRCASCRGRRLAWDRVVRLGAYSGVLRDAVLDLKFHAWREAGTALGRELGRALSEALRHEARGREVVLVPLPMTLRRRLWRGIDHTLTLARGVREVLGCRMVRPITREHRPSQVDLPTGERRSNMSGAFRIRRGMMSGPAGLGPGRVVVLLDDVMTTGATMTAACRSVRILIGSSAEIETRGEQQSSELWAAVVGVTPLEGRREHPGVGSAGVVGEVDGTSASGGRV